MDALQSKINTALQHDQKKEQVNDAKLRAVAQRVDYDDFCKMVAGAHLKPVKPCSQASADISKPFELFVLPKFDSKAGAAAIPEPAAQTEFVCTTPKDANEFNRVWRRKCKTSQAKLCYLRCMEPEYIPVLFRAEMDPSVLDGIVDAIQTALNGILPNDETALSGEGECLLSWAEQTLLNVSRVNRFHLTLQLADASTTAALHQIFEKLENRPAQERVGKSPDRLPLAEIGRLRQIFEV
mmetsp:Transcript_18987/g.41014  ORF Transcript_18987/g.41014 Transcript_18987/m.41014 type:complete len:239 (-) Transcript_18987:287-1003(-)